MINNYTSLVTKLGIAAALLFSFSFNAQAQNCFEIRSILVDACGSPEGENEMVRFDVGNAPLTIADLDITFPSNSFKGICQDANTALKVDTLNSGITGCGLLVEPTGGILPANAKVLLVTSTDFSTTFNSFANLNDTLLIIFQCAGNTGGHFANNSSTPGLRTLIMSYANPAGCIDSVTYDRSLLVNQGGGTGGSSSFNDGALVEFDSAGNATYLNYGCQALVASLNTMAGSDRIFCSAATIYFYGNVTGTYTSLQWSGGAGAFGQPNSAATSYVVSLTDTGWIPIWLTATGPCGTSSTDTLHVYFPQSITAPILTANGAALTCSLQSTNFTYVWTLNGAPDPGSFYLHTASTAGCYQVAVADTFGCTILSDTVCVAFAGLSNMNQNLNISLQPNPAANVQHLQITSQQIINQLTLQLFNVTGQQLITKSYEVKQNKFETDLDLTALSKGFYFLKLRSENSNSTIKVVKE